MTRFNKFQLEDHPQHWSDAHIQHVVNWLIASDKSPYKDNMRLLTSVLGLTRNAKREFKRCIKTRGFSSYNFAFRFVLTKNLTQILSGTSTPVIIWKNENKTRFTVELKINNPPQPLCCPPFYRGSISIGKHGLQVRVTRSDASLHKKHDPAGAARLLNPFGAR